MRCIPGQTNIKENELAERAAKNAIADPLTLTVKLITKRELIASVKMAGLLEFNKS